MSVTDNGAETLAQAEEMNEEQLIELCEFLAVELFELEGVQRAKDELDIYGYAYELNPCKDGDRLCFRAVGQVRNEVPAYVSTGDGMLAILSKMKKQPEKVQAVFVGYLRLDLKVATPLDLTPLKVAQAATVALQEGKG